LELLASNAAAKTAPNSTEDCSNAHCLGNRQRPSRNYDGFHNDYWRLKMTVQFLREPAPIPNQMIGK